MIKYRLPTINRDEATEVWVKRSRGHDVHLDSISLDVSPHDMPEIDTLTDADLDELKGQLQMTKESYSDDSGACRRAFVSEVDAEVTQYVHEFVTSLGLSPFQLSQVDFWAWLSHVPCDGFFWDFIDWRYKKDQGMPPKKYWGICRLSEFHEIYFAGSWLRAHKVFDSRLDDPYQFTRIGGNDNWRNQILRVDVGLDSEFIKALVEIIEEGGYTRSAVREKIVPPLRAWTSSANFANLDYEASKRLIKHLIKVEI